MIRNDLPHVVDLENRVYGPAKVRKILYAMMEAHDKAEGTEHFLYPVSHMSTYAEMLEAALTIAQESQEDL